MDAGRTMTRWSPRRTVSRQFEARFALISHPAALPSPPRFVSNAMTESCRGARGAGRALAWLFAATLVGVSGIAWIRRILFRRVENCAKARYFGVLGPR